MEMALEAEHQLPAQYEYFKLLSFLMVLSFRLS